MAKRVLGGLVLAFLVAMLAGRAAATTAPGQVATIHVKLSDGGISIQYQAQEARGVIARFLVVNDGKKPHNFSLLGRTTPVLKPGGAATFTVTLANRGMFPYRSTVDKGADFHGDFIVY